MGKLGCLARWGETMAALTSSGAVVVVHRYVAAAVPVVVAVAVSAVEGIVVKGGH